MRGISRLRLWSIAALLAAGCGSGDTVNVGGTPGGNPSGGTPGAPSGGAVTVDFATQIQPIFTNNCAFTGCHASDTASAGLVLEAGQAYDNLVNVTSTEVAPDKRVVPGNSAASYLIEKLTQVQPRAGGRMPLGSNPLPEDQIALIRTWINEGAPRSR